MAESSRAVDRRSWGPPALLLLWVVVTAVYGAFAADRWRSRGPTDFYLLWSVGQALLHLPVENVYTEPDRSAITEEMRDRAGASGSPARVAGARGWNRFEPISTPFLYAVFALASTGDFDLDYARFRLVSLAGYLATVFGLALVVGFRPWAGFLAVVFFTAAYWPFYTDSGFANVSQLQVGLVGLYLAIRRRDGTVADLASGAVLGFILYFKPTVTFCAALLVLDRVIERRWGRLARQALGLGAMTALAGLLPWWLFGGACTWPEWQRGAPDIFLTGRYLAGGFLGRMFGPLPLWVHSIFSFGVLVAVSTFLIRHLRGPGKPPPQGDTELLLVALGLALFVLTAPVAHSHYFLLAVPLALLAIAPGQPLGRRLAGIGAILLPALHPLWKSLGLVTGRNQSLASFLGVWLLVFLVLYGTARSHATHDPSDEPA